MNKTFPLLFLLAVVLGLSYQPTLQSQPNTIWAKIYNGPAVQQDSSVGICVNSLGMVFVTGWSIGSGSAADIVTIRYNPDTGDTLWVNRYNGVSSLEDKVSAITCDDNAVYVTGWSLIPSRDIITIKYDAATGNRLWVRTYNGTGNGGDYGFAIAVDPSGNVYTTGRSDVGSGQGQKFTTLKYDAAGNIVAGWPYVYTGPLSNTGDQAQAIRLDGSSNVYVTGKSGTGTFGTEDYLTIKINANATLGWAKKHNGTGNSEDNAVALVIDNTFTNVYVGGYSFRFGGVQDYMTIRYSCATGDSNAAASYNGPQGSTDQMSQMTIDNTNNVYVTGYSSGAGTSYDFATIKYNSALAQQWVQRTTNSGTDIPFSISVENVSGNVYVAGSSIGTGYDYLTISYRSNGTFNWEKRESGTANGNDYISGVAVQDTDRIFVTGSANFSGTGIAFYTLRYSKISAINPVSGVIPSSFQLKQNYPNPFNPSTSIRFDIPNASFVRVSVYDVMGRELENLVNEQLKAGEYMVKWDAARFASGIYFYSIAADGYQTTKKMMLIK